MGRATAIRQTVASVMLTAAVVVLVIGSASAAAAQRDRSAIVASLRGSPWRVRLATAHRLGENGATWAVPALVAVLHADVEPRVRAECATVLARLGGEPVRTELQAALRDPSPLVRTSAANAIAWLGPQLPSGCGPMVEAVFERGWTLHLCGDGSVHRTRAPAPTRH